jgi:hypothetical protein
MNGGTTLVAMYSCLVHVLKNKYSILFCSPCVARAKPHSCTIRLYHHLTSCSLSIWPVAYALAVFVYMASSAILHKF